MSLKFSIITPSFNQGNYIKDTIESVLSQNYSNFEHIIIDGSSTDNTVEILKSYSHLKWISEPDKGPANAINKGFEMATGDIYAWLNSDDYYEENIFGKVSEIFNSDKIIKLVFGNLTFVDNERNILCKDETYRIDREYLINENADVVRQPSSFFLSELFYSIGRLDENLRLVFDYDLFIRMLEKTEPYFLNENLAFYREYPSTLTRSNIRLQAQEIFRVSRKYGGKLMSRLNYTNVRKILFQK